MATPAQRTATFADAVRPGALLAGKYRVDRVLGEGGMGVVVAATHLQLGERVAIKLLRPELSPQSDAVARFFREARAAARLHSEHVARVTDAGYLESGTPYMVMEYLEGEDLARMLAERGPLPIAEAVGAVLQACEAVAEAHVAGIVHRDLKPANLFVTSRPDGSPCVKVLDFGISKLASTDARAMTTPAMLLGSPLYMSPEQLRSAHDVDARTDIWALAVILFELVTGRPPFSAATLGELVAAIVQGPPPSLRALRPDAPPELEAIVMRCLEKDPARRYADLAELAMALRAVAPVDAAISVDRVSGILRRSRISSTPPAVAPPVAQPPPRAAPFARARRAARAVAALCAKRLPWIAAGCGLAILAIVAGVVALLAGNGRSDDATIPIPEAPPPPADIVLVPDPVPPARFDLDGRIVARQGNVLSVAVRTTPGAPTPAVGQMGILHGEAAGGAGFVPIADVIVSSRVGPNGWIRLDIAGAPSAPRPGVRGDPFAKNARVKLVWTR